MELKFTDGLLAEKFVKEALVRRFIYSRGMGWMRWTGTRWQRTDFQHVTEAARRWVLKNHRIIGRRRDKALASNNRAEAGTLGKIEAQWERYLHISRLAALVKLAEGHDLTTCHHDDFDADPYLLNCLNGIVDLRTGEISPHDPSVLITRLAAARYRRDAKHEDWDKALTAVPGDIRGWYQLRMGQAITGKMTPDDLLIIQQGGGANGKSTIMSAIQATIADYFLFVARRALSTSPDTVPTEIADFKGVRFAALEELPEERQLSVVWLKSVVGTPIMQGRFMREDSMYFTASHTLFISSNYAPNIVETDHGTWRRLALVRFPYHYVKTEAEIRCDFDIVGDPMLRERLREGVGQREAVLAWLVEGAVRYFADGGYEKFTTLPVSVRSDTGQWRKDNDLVLRYICEHLTFDADSAILRSELLDDFNSFLADNGQRSWSDKTFKQRFSGHEEIANRGVLAESCRREKYGLSRPPRRPWQSGIKSDTVRVWAGVAFSQEVETAPPEIDPDTGWPAET